MRDYEYTVEFSVGNDAEFAWREYQRWMTVLEESKDSETAFTAWCQAGRYWRSWISANDKILGGKNDSV